MKKRIRLFNNRLLVIVLFLVFITHLSYIFNDFAWLDHGDIVAGRSIVSLFNLREIFLKPFAQTSFYRPIVTIFNSIDYTIWGNLAYGFHLTNVLLHIIAVYAVYIFSQAYFMLDRKMSLLASFIFGVHPITWLPVGAISYRPELLVTVFTLFAVYFHIKARLEKKSYGILAYIFIILALFSKETAILWIPLLLYAWEVKKKGNYKIALKKIHYGEILILVSYFVFRLLLVPIKWTTLVSELNLSQALGTRLLVISKQLTYIISPLKPVLSDATSITKILSIYPLLVLIIFIITILLIRKLKYKNVYSQVAIFLFIALFPALNIIPLPRFNSPHYAYFASIGFAVLIATFFFKYKNADGKIIQIIIILWAVVSIYSTFSSGFNFRNDMTLFIPETEKDKNFLEGHFYIANYYFKNIEFEKAEFSYEKANEDNKNVIAYVDKYSTKLNLAGVKLGLGKLDEAEKLLIELSEEKSGKHDINIIYNLALIYWEREDYKKVIDTISPIEFWDSAEPLLLLSKAYIASGLNKEAIEQLEESLKFLNNEQKKSIETLIRDIKEDEANNL